MNSILVLARIQIAIIVTFVLNKVLIRPFILENSDDGFWTICVLSYSNFCEAIVGTLSVTYIWLVINNKWIKPENRVQEKFIYIFATVFAGIFVILQELKIHNLGGRNVYDPNDVVFSVIGLIAAYLMLIRLKPQISNQTN